MILIQTNLDLIRVTYCRVPPQQGLLFSMEALSGRLLFSFIFHVSLYLSFFVLSFAFHFVIFFLKKKVEINECSF